MHSRLRRRPRTLALVPCLLAEVARAPRSLAIPAEGTEPGTHPPMSDRPNESYDSARWSGRTAVCPQRRTFTSLFFSVSVMSAKQHERIRAVEASAHDFTIRQETTVELRLHSPDTSRLEPTHSQNSRQHNWNFVQEAGSTLIISIHSCALALVPLCPYTQRHTVLPFRTTCVNRADSCRLESRTRPFSSSTWNV
jgi:hypothetical protein